MSGINWVDYIIIGVFLFSVLAGLMRGVVKEVVSVLSWLAAFIFASIFSSRLAASFTGSESVQSAVGQAGSTIGMDASQPVSIVATGLSFIGIFIVVVMIGSMLGYIMTRTIEGGGISFVNRILGGVFGLARGFLVVLLMVFLVDMTSFAAEPWWNESRFVAQYKPLVQWLSEKVQPGLESVKARVGEKINSGMEGVQRLF